MKKLVISLFTGIVALTTIQNTKADVIANWTFESSGLGSSTPSFAPGAATTTTNFYAEFGAQAGTATVFGLHTAAATYTSPVGNGSAKSLSSTAWQTGSDYFQ